MATALKYLRLIRVLVFLTHPRPNVPLVIMYRYLKMNFYISREPLRRSVRIEGHVEKIESRLSDEYFASRPFESQVGT